MSQQQGGAAFIVAEEVKGSEVSVIASKLDMEWRLLCVALDSVLFDIDASIVEPLMYQRSRVARLLDLSMGRGGAS